jgi:transposase
MAKRKRRSFDKEFKAEAVRLCKVGDRSVREVARDLDLTETALRAWAKQADVDAGKGPPEALTTAEREELARLRREVKRLEMERDILKAAALDSTGGRKRGCVGWRANGANRKTRNVRFAKGGTLAAVEGRRVA